MSASRAVIDAAWRPLIAAIAQRDGVAALSAVPAAGRVGLLGACGPAILLALADHTRGPAAAMADLSAALLVRDWAGDDALSHLLTSPAAGSGAGRRALRVDLDDVADLLEDQGGGWIDLETGCAGLRNYST